MTTFVVLAPASSLSLTDLKAAMERVFPDRFFEIAPGQYVAVASDLSPVQIGERLGSGGQVGQFVVFSTGGHYGWHRTDLWDWLKAKASE